MKRNILFFALFLFVTCLMAQENERPIEKGRLLKSRVLASPSNYQTVSTILSPADISQWHSIAWKKNSASSKVLFTTGKYQNSTNYRLESPAIQLPQLNNPFERYNLYIEEQYELESHYDAGKVVVSEDGGQSWRTLSTRSGKSDLRTLVVNLTAYAGKTVKMAFVLNTDEANTYAGWDIQHVAIKQELLVSKPSATFSNSSSAGAYSLKGTSTNELSGAITNLDAQKFPRFVFAHFNVSQGDVALDNLDESNFSITETIDGVTTPVNKDLTYHVYTPGNDTISMPVDVVFLMDNSGSMQGEKDAIAANVESFAADLEARGFDYRLAFTRFGSYTNDGNPIFYNNAGWYDDDSLFVQAWNTGNAIGGSDEPSWDALYFSSTNYSFRAGAQKIFILITDEDMTGYENNQQFCQKTDKQEIIDQLQATGVTTYALVPANWSNSWASADYESDYGQIADSTGGKSYLITDPFNDILDDIGTKINNTYAIRYTPTNPEFDGKTREVEITVQYNTEVLTLTGEYTPGTAPVVIRTDNTLEYHQSAQLNNQSIEITAYVTDKVAPFTQSVTLFYRTVGSGDDYKELVMTASPLSANEAIWSATIPAIDVVEPGIQYYMKATDGEATTTAPEFIDKEGYPWSFAVWPNLPPVIDGEELGGQYVAGDLVDFSAEAEDNTSYLSEVIVYIKGNLDLSFNPYPMTLVSGDDYLFENYVVQDGITEYYYVAIDNHGVSSFDGSELDPKSFIVGGCAWPTTSSSVVHSIMLKGMDFSSMPPAPFVTDIQVAGAAVEVGDLVGVFYSTPTGDVCSGYAVWSGSPILSLNAFADDPSTPEKDGFSVGEELVFKIMKQDDCSVYSASHKAIGVTGAVVFTPNALTNMEYIKGENKHSVDLSAGENLWSTYLIPEDLSFDAIFANFSHVEKVVDGQGSQWVPGGGSSNSLTQYTPGYGYKVYSTTGGVIEVVGDKADLSQLDVNLIGGGYTLIGCPYSSPESVEAVFVNDPASNIYSVDKYIYNGSSTPAIENYFPKYNYNFWVDKNMQPGDAYYVYALNTDNNFSFPAATGAYIKATSMTVGTIPQRVQKPGEYMAVVLPGNTWDYSVSAGSEVRAYDNTGRLVGRAAVNTNGTVVVLDGMNVDEGADFELRLWSAAGEQESGLEVTAWEIGQAAYENHAVAIAAQISSDELGMNNQVVSVYPNPAKEQVNVKFTVAENNEVEISLFNLNGQLVKQIPAGQYQAGEHVVKVSVESVTPGVYHLQVKCGKTVTDKKVVVTK